MDDPATRDRAELDAVPASKVVAVIEALELYMCAEEMYVAANASLSNPQTTRTSNAANWGSYLAEATGTAGAQSLSRAAVPGRS